MKIELVAVAFLVLCSFLSATSSTSSRKVVPLRGGSHQVAGINKAVSRKCDECLAFSKNYLKDVLEAIDSTTVTGGCAGLCVLVNEKVKDRLFEAVCFTICTAAGITTFVETLRLTIDPYEFCDLIKLCPEDDRGDAEIKSITIKPNPVKQNSSWKVEVYFDTENGIGLGQIDLNVTEVINQKAVLVDDETVDPLGTGEWLVAWNYGPPNWGPGNFTLNIAICYGECWSGAKHSKVYDFRSANFSVV